MLPAKGHSCARLGLASRAAGRREVAATARKGRRRPRLVGASGTPSGQRDNIMRWRKAERGRLIAQRLAISNDERIDRARHIEAHLDMLLPDLADIGRFVESLISEAGPRRSARAAPLAPSPLLWRKMLR